MVSSVGSVSSHAALAAQPLSGHTGVSVTGARVSELSDEQVEDVRRLVSEYCVAIFPGQHLKPVEQVAFVSRLGRVITTPGTDTHPAHELVNVVANRGSADRPRSGGFHTDTCFVDRPPSYTSLSGIEIPDHGGDTIFCNQYLAYESLSSVMKGWLADLRFKHVVSGTERPEEVPNPVWHPAVRTNPVTGRKALYITYSSRCIEAEGMTLSEGANLITFLYEQSLAAHAMYRHRWSTGDFVMWDNRCTLHAAVYDHGDQPRTLNRVMCEGEAPY